MEQRRLAESYLQKAGEATNLRDIIKHEVLADELLHPIEGILENSTPEQRIDTFHGTWLSNFYAVSVEMDGVRYPSVEHAYQARKFNPDDIRNLPDDKQTAIREFFREKGYGRDVEDLSTIFADNTVTSGIIKRVSELLQDYGILDTDWGNKRLDTMTELLIQKYQHEELAKRLLATGDTILIEGNDWNDTYWGVCEDIGKNMLGRLLMNIREKIKSDQLKVEQNVLT